MQAQAVDGASTRTRWRSRVAAVCGGSLIVATTLLAIPAGAQTLPIRPAAVPGTANAQASAFQFGLALSGELGSGGGLGVDRGAVEADATDLAGTSTAFALNVGLIAKLDYRPPPQCPPIAPRFAPQTVPAATKAESTDPAGPTPRPTEVRWPGQEVVGEPAGVQDATAGPDTRSNASTSVGDVAGPFVSASGLRSESSAFVEPSGRRVARSLVAASSIDLGGFATIHEPRFVAVAASDGSSTASFTFDWVYAFGQYHTGQNGHRALQDAKNVLEGLFAGLGLKIDLPAPTVSTRTNPTTDTNVRVEVDQTPLRVRLSNIPLARDLIGPILRLVEPALAELEANIRADVCADQSLLSVLGVARSSLGGAGELGTSIGGVRAVTTDRWIAPRAPRTTTTTAPAVVTTIAPLAPPTEIGGIQTQAPRRQPARQASAPVTPTDTPVTTVAEPPPTTAEPAPKVERETTSDPEVALPARTTTAQEGERGGLLTWVSLVLLAGVLSAAIADRFVLKRGSVT